MTVNFTAFSDKEKTMTTTTNDPKKAYRMIAISNKDAQKKAPSVAPSLADLPVRVHTIKG